MSQIRTPDDIKQLGTIVGIWAHPDDESFLAAGILHTAINNGQTVVCITATCGEAGVQDETRWPANKLGGVRRHEMAAALKVLGIEHHYWLDCLDGHCRDMEMSIMVEQLLSTITPYKPDTILTFGPDGWTGHPDHQTISHWTDGVIKQLPKKPKVYHAVSTPEHYRKYLKPADKLFNIFFNIDQPPLHRAAECDIYYELPKEVAERKCAALKAMPSQTDAIFQALPESKILATQALETFILKS